MAAKSKNASPAPDFSAQDDSGEGQSEIFNFLMSDEELFADFVQVGGDLDGFWSPLPGEGIKGVVEETRQITTAYGEKTLLVFRTENPVRIYNEDDPDSLAMAGSRIAVFASWTLAQFPNSAWTKVRPRCALKFSGVDKIKGGKQLRRYDLRVAPNQAREFQLLASGAQPAALAEGIVEGSFQEGMSAAAPAVAAS